MRGFAVFAATIAVLTGCDGDDDVSAPSAVVASAPATTSSATTTIATTPTTTTMATVAPPSTSVAPDLDPVTCLDGIWSVVTLTAANGNLEFVGPVTGMTMSFGDGRWTLDAAAATVAVEVNGIAGTATLDGEANGLIVEPSGQLTFQLSGAIGTAIAEADGLQRDLSFEELLVALGPVGTATVTCEGTTAVLATRTTSLDLQRAG